MILPGKKYHVHMIVTLLAIVLSGVSVRADDSGGRLTLLDAVDLAIEHYPAVNAARAAVDETRAASGEARSEWFPTLSFGATAVQYSDPMPVNPIHGFSLDRIPVFDERTGAYGLSLGYAVLDGGGRLARSRMARSRYEAAGAAYEENRQDIIARVIEVYLDVLGAREVLQAHEARVKALESELSRTRQHYEQERAARVEVLRVEAALAGAEADRVRAGSSLEVSSRELALLTGVEPGDTDASRLIRIVLADSAIGEREAIVSRALISSPAVQRAQQGAVLAEAGLAAARSARFPRLELGGNYYNLGDFEGNRVTEWQAEASLSFPLFTGGLVTKRISAAEAALRGAREEVKIAEYDIRQRVDRALAALDESRARLVSLERAVEAQEELVKIEKLLLETGAGTQMDYLDAEAELVTMRASLVEARHRQTLAQADAARAVLTELESGTRREELAQAVAARDAAKEKADDAFRDLKKAEKLFEGGAISREALDKAKTLYDVSHNLLIQAEEMLCQLETGPRGEKIEAQRAILARAEAGVVEAEAVLANMTIRAPFAGVVSIRHREPGETVPAGAPVLTLQDPEDRWVRIYIPEKRIGAVHIGSRAIITTDTFEEREYSGEVVFISTEAEFTPKTVQTTEERVRLVYAVKVRITGDESHDLKPGMPADVELELST